MNFHTFIGALIISLFTCAGVAATSVMLFTADIPASSEKFAILIFGALVSSFGQVTQFWLGSSAEGARKDKAISDVATTVSKEKSP